MIFINCGIKRYPKLVNIDIATTNFDHSTFLRQSLAPFRTFASLRPLPRSTFPGTLPYSLPVHMEYIVRYTPQVLDQCIVQLTEGPIVAGNTNLTTDFTIAGLVPYSTYSVEVLARNSIGFGVSQNRTIRTAESGETSFI